MTATEIIEFHLKMEQEHYEKLMVFYNDGERQIEKQKLLVHKLKQILQEIKEQGK